MWRYVRHLCYFTALVLLMMSLGCNSTPPRKEIKQAVKESLEKRVPIALAGAIIGGEDARVESVHVLQIGKAQGRGSSKYWPVKVYATGTCSVLFVGRKNFEGEAEFHISKDPYGKWIASSAGM